MIFKPELIDQVLVGRKTVTRRLVSDNPRSPWFRDGCSLNVGQDYAVVPGRGEHQVARVLVTAVDQQRAGRITNADAVLEGFRHRGEFITYWERMHGTFDPEALVWRIQFRLVQGSARA